MIGKCRKKIDQSKKTKSSQRNRVRQWGRAGEEIRKRLHRREKIRNSRGERIRMREIERERKEEKERRRERRRSQFEEEI